MSEEINDKYLEVKVADEIWLMEKHFHRFGGYEHSQIVCTMKESTNNAEDGWTVTHYVKAQEA